MELKPTIIYGAQKIGGKPAIKRSAGNAKPGANLLYREVALLPHQAPSVLSGAPSFCRAPDASEGA
jgi:hypothetical protein